MPKSFEDEPAFILHARSYGDTSLIIDAFTRTFGRISLYARGAKAKKKQGIRPLLNPFIPVNITGVGKGSLKSLTAIESTGAAYSLRGRSLYCGFYLNELLVRLLPEEDSQTELFEFYTNIVTDLAAHDPDWGDAPLEVLLRTFEWLLVQQVGQSFSLVHDANTGQPVEFNKHYIHQFQTGMVACEMRSGAISGKALIEFSVGNLADAESRREIKELMRAVLKPLLGARPLNSRALFR